MIIKLMLLVPHEPKKGLPEIDLPFIPPIGSVYEHESGPMIVRGIHFTSSAVLLKLRRDFDDTE